MSEHPGVLSSIRVIDLSELLPGPNATRMLAGLGAEVIKVERPGGDRLRHRPGMFDPQNRGKRSIVLDLKTEAGRRTLARLVETADVLVEGYRPGVLDKLGLGFANLQAVNPELIYVSISGYGSDGPYRDVPGHDFQYLAFAGGIPEPDIDFAARYTPTSVPVADMASSLYASLGIVLAILDKVRTGPGFQGRHLEVAMSDCALALMEPRVSEASYEARQEHSPTAAGPLRRPAYGVYRTKDGRYVSVGALEDHFYQRLMEAVGLPSLTGPDYASYGERRARFDEIESALRRRLEEYERDELVALLIGADVPVAPVYSMIEPLDDPHHVARGMVTDRAGEKAAAEWPRVIGDFVDRDRLTPTPRTGEHYAQILMELGLTTAEIDELVRDRGVVVEN